MDNIFNTYGNRLFKFYAKHIAENEVYIWNIGGAHLVYSCTLFCDSVESNYYQILVVEYT